jgi:hypothetical protein
MGPRRPRLRRPPGAPPPAVRRRGGDRHQRREGDMLLCPLLFRTTWEEECVRVVKKSHVTFAPSPLATTGPNLGGAGPPAPVGVRAPGARSRRDPDPIGRPARTGAGPRVVRGVRATRPARSARAPRNLRCPCEHHLQGGGEGAGGPAAPRAGPGRGARVHDPARTAGSRRRPEPRAPRRRRPGGPSCRASPISRPGAGSSSRPERRTPPREAAVTRSVGRRR